MGPRLISFLVTLTRAIDIGFSTHEVDFDVYLVGAKQVFTGHLYTSYLTIPRLPFTYPPIWPCRCSFHCRVPCDVPGHFGSSHNDLPDLLSLRLP